MGVSRRHHALLVGLLGCRAGTELPAPTLVVADVEGGALLRVGPESGAVELLSDAADVPAQDLPAGFQPAGVAVDGDRLVVTDFAAGGVLAFSPESGAWLRTLRRQGDDDLWLEEPCAVEVLPDGLAVLGNDTRNLVLIGDQGPFLELGGSTAPSIRDGHGVAALPDGRLVVATSPSDPSLGLLQVWEPTEATRVDTWLPVGQVADATDVALGPDGLLYVADWTAGEVLRVDPVDGGLVDLVLGPDLLDRPVALAFDPGGRLWVLERHGLVSWSPAEGGQRILDDAFAFGRGLAVLPGP